jgi:hypothetical protein
MTQISILHSSIQLTLFVVKNMESVFHRYNRLHTILFTKEGLMVIHAIDSRSFDSLRI